MAIEIIIPRLGWSMDEGVFVERLKRDGEVVKAGEPVFSLETEKAIQEIEAGAGGVVRWLEDGPKPGDTVKVGAVIGFLDEPAAAQSASAQIVSQIDDPAPAPDIVSTPLRKESEEGTSTAASAPKTDVDSSPLPRGSQRASSASADRRWSASPRARRAATELGVALDQLKGSGAQGRIRERDVRLAASEQSQEAAHEAFNGGQTIPLSANRKIIAKRLRSSLDSVVPVTITSTAAADNLVSLRSQFKAAASSARDIPSITDFVVKLASLALQRHPIMYATWTDAGIRMNRAINIGVAVNLPDSAGLVVPVIRNVETLSLRAVAARSQELIDQARRAALRAEDTQGGRFTVSNLGSWDVDAFTPVINPPETAILGIGRIRRVPVVCDDEVAIGAVVTVSLTFDHRVVDGAPAAAFLQDLRLLIENPAPSLIS